TPAADYQRRGNEKEQRCARLGNRNEEIGRLKCARGEGVEALIADFIDPAVEQIGRTGGSRSPAKPEAAAGGEGNRGGGGILHKLAIKEITGIARSEERRVGEECEWR